MSKVLESQISKTTIKVFLFNISQKNMSNVTKLFEILARLGQHKIHISTIGFLKCYKMNINVTKKIMVNHIVLKVRCSCDDTHEYGISF